MAAIGAIGHSPEHLPKQTHVIAAANRRERDRAAGSRLSLRDWLLLPACLCLVPLLYFPYLFHNLPVAVNVDERTALVILERFHHGSLNPQFFMYPTLYYYLTYLWTAAGPANNSVNDLLWGRVLNLGLVGLTAFVSYAFCKRHLASPAAGWIAALCVISSPIITNSGSYLCTDVLLAATTMGSLHYLVAYFAGDGRRSWLPGMLLLGAAVGSKYTAFLLFLAYYLAEWIVSVRRPAPIEAGQRSAYLSRTAVISLLMAAGGAALLAACLFPVQAALHFAAGARTNADLGDPAEYLRFFQHLRRLLGEVAVLCFVMAAAARLSRRVYAGLARKKPYLGLAIVLLVTLLSTPYSLITPRRFLYDLGALARANIVVASPHAEWGQYLAWLFSHENGILVALGIVGLGLIAARARAELIVAGLYLVLYGVVIGSAHIGYPRYLTPVLPLLYCGTGAALVTLWQWRPPAAGTKSGIGSSLWIRATIVLLAVTVAIQLGVKIARERALSRGSDAFLASYDLARHNLSGTDLYAGYAPFAELDAAGVRTRQVSWAALSNGPIGDQMSCADLLLFDTQGARRHGIDASADKSLILMLDAPGGDGQQVMRRRDCP